MPLVTVTVVTFYLRSGISQGKMPCNVVVLKIRQFPTFNQSAGRDVMTYLLSKRELKKKSCVQFSTHELYERH
jgi:hypothetical protein